MSLIISGITLPFTEPQELAIEKAQQKLGNIPTTNATILKKSVDARRKNKINFVYSISVDIQEDEHALVKKLNNNQVNMSKNTDLSLSKGSQKLESRPVIVGFGPAGMFAGLLLAREGYRPIILERGQSVDIRIQDVHNFWETGVLKKESNVQFGEGGAGTFSDGKLTTRIGDPYCRFILEELVRHGAPEEILYNAKPHVGTDHLRSVVRNIRREIISLGGDVHFGQCFNGISLDSKGAVTSVQTSTAVFPCQSLLLALGHSARDTFAMLHQNNILMESKPFSVGLRVEHLQSEIDTMLYGDSAGHPLLPKGEYQLSHRDKERAVYTFCMCPGGVVVPASSEDGMITTNGMSAYARNETNANSALVVSVNKSDFPSGPLGGIQFQEQLEKSAYNAGGGGYKAPIQTVGHFLKEKKGYSPNRVLPSYARGIRESDFSKMFSQPIVSMMKTGLEKFDQRMRGFSASDILLTGVETRTSSPVRIPRNPVSLQAVNTPGLYPCGEGAGYAGGIMSAAVDGMRSAQAIIEMYSPF